MKKDEMVDLIATRLSTAEFAACCMKLGAIRNGLRKSVTANFPDPIQRAYWRKNIDDYIAYQIKECSKK